MSKKQELIDVKTALAALQVEIIEAKAERKTAKSQLEKAIQEGLPVSSFEKLLDSASANLTGLQSKEKELMVKERMLEKRMTRSPSTSDQEVSPTSDGSPKRRKIDNLIASSKKYLLRTVNWGCVTVIGRRRAITFAHNEHRFLKSINEINQIKDNLRADDKSDNDIDSEIGKYVSDIKIYSTEKASVESESRVNTLLISR
jgi:hypothetical protein